eukprot:TRINITY_DN2988_c0_g1_i1.p2 TRINITY_DN2988_c0_g1~~TRINITY_DN2988_c0_g1_i1.p2  ORF type:complete len:105 (+),score=16.44 TRINITY_DN2988_c0_g1_i1:260-574(+)
MAPVGNLTRSQLAVYNGSDSSKPLLVAVKGNIYDVTSAPNFYGKGGNYHCLVGKDASRALGRMSLEKPDLESSVLSDLTSEQVTTLNEWEGKFRAKYPVVGRLV